MTKYLPQLFLSSIATLAIGLGLGRYVFPTSKTVEISPNNSAETAIETAPTAASQVVQNSFETQTIAAPEEIVTKDVVVTENEELRLKVATLEKSLKTYTDQEKLEPIYDSQESRTKLVDEMLEITDMKKQIESGFDTAADMMLKDIADPEKRKVGAALINKYFSWEKIGPEMTKIYANVYSADDLQKINKFYKTEAGQMMLDKTPELMAEVMKTMQKLNEENLPKLMPELTKLLPPKETAKKPKESQAETTENQAPKG